MIGTHQASRMLPRAGADAHRHLQPVAGVGRHRRRAHERAADEASAPGRGPTRTRRWPGPRRGSRRPATGAVGRLEPHPGDAAVRRLISSTARMPVCGSMPRSRQALSSGPTSPCPAPRSSRILRRSSSAGGDALRGAAAQARLAHRDVARQLRADRHPVLPLAELGEREQRALERAAAAGLRAGVLGVVVGEVLDDLEPDGRVRLEPRHDLGPGVDQRAGEVAGR